MGEIAVIGVNDWEECRKALDGVTIVRLGVIRVTVLEGHKSRVSALTTLGDKSRVSALTTLGDKIVSGS